VSFICGLVWITCQLTAVTVFSSSTSFFVTVSSLTVLESWQIYREYGPFDPLYPLLPLLCLENPAVVLRIVFSFCTFFCFRLSCLLWRMLQFLYLPVLWWYIGAELLNVSEPFSSLYLPLVS